MNSALNNASQLHAELMQALAALQLERMHKQYWRRKARNADARIVQWQQYAQRFYNAAASM